MGLLYVLMALRRLALISLELAAVTLPAGASILLVPIET